jgi:uncharacterized membrane protein
MRAPTRQAKAVRILRHRILPWLTLAYHLAVGVACFQIAAAFRTESGVLQDKVVFQFAMIAVFVESVYRSSRALRKLAKRGDGPE